MPVTVLRQDQLRRMPWRNGGGVTAEVARSPEGPGESPFDWRVSFAEVAQSGGFSLFPGVERTIVLLAGPPMLLRLPHHEHVLRMHEPFRFDGAAEVHCTVEAPTRDLNVMVRRDRRRAEVDVVPAHDLAGPPTDAVTLVAVLEAAEGLVLPDGRRLDVGDVAMSTDGTAVDVRGSGVVAVVRISPTGP